VRGDLLARVVDVLGSSPRSRVQYSAIAVLASVASCGSSTELVDDVEQPAHHGEHPSSRSIGAVEPIS
jgi:hypothetical protein